MYRYDLLIDKFLENKIDSLLQEMYKKPLLDIIDNAVADLLQDANLGDIYEKYRIYRSCCT